MHGPGIRGTGLSQPVQVDSRKEFPYVVLGQEVTDWGRIAPCWLDTNLRQKRGAWLHKFSRREGKCLDDEIEVVWVLH